MKIQSITALLLATLVSLSAVACDAGGEPVPRDRSETSLANDGDDVRTLAIAVERLEIVDLGRDAYEMTVLVDNRGGAAMSSLSLHLGDRGSEALAAFDEEIAADAVAELTTLVEGLDLARTSSLRAADAAVDAASAPVGSYTSEAPEPLARAVWSCTRTVIDGWQCWCVANCEF